jgi:hypothetical protein
MAQVKLEKSVSAKLLLKKGYKRCPSVTTGGKQYFYFRCKGYVRQWIVWNKVMQCWVYEHKVNEQAKLLSLLV